MAYFLPMLLEKQPATWSCAGGGWGWAWGGSGGVVVRKVQLGLSPRSQGSALALLCTVWSRCLLIFFLEFANLLRASGEAVEPGGLQVEVNPNDYSIGFFNPMLVTDARFEYP